MPKPVRFIEGVPVYTGRDAYKELFRQWGIPNWVPQDGETPFMRHRLVLFVDDFNNGQPMAYLEELR